jgi:polyisoprenoid-binding protein YceI
MKTKLHTLALFAGSIALWLLAGAPLPAAEQMTRFDARSGSKMRLEGTSLVHDWQAQSTLIMGFLEVGPNFPTEPGQVVSPGKVEARSEASVKVKSLRSIEKNGAPYDDKMDAKMYSMFQETNYPTIVFRLSELVLKEAPKDKDAPYVFDAKGDLAVSGVTNKISLPVNIVPLGETKGETRLKITGAKDVKMSDFKIEPAKIVVVKTSDDVKIKFEWIVGHKKPATADASK